MIKIRRDILCRCLNFKKQQVKFQKTAFKAHLYLALIPTFHLKIFFLLFFKKSHFVSFEKKFIILGTKLSKDLKGIMLIIRLKIKNFCENRLVLMIIVELKFFFVILKEKIILYTWGPKSKFLDQS